MKTKMLNMMVVIIAAMAMLFGPSLAVASDKEKITIECSDPQVCKDLAHLFVPPAPPVTAPAPEPVEESAWRTLFHYALGAGGGAAIGAAGYTIGVLAGESKELDVGALVGTTIGSAVGGVILTTLLREF